MPFTYRQVKDLYDTLADAGAVKKPLAEWSGDMSAMTGSDLYDAGLHDNVIKRASVGIDRALEATGLTKLGGDFGRAVSEPFGMGDQGQSIGEGLPRMAVNFIPAIAAEALTGGAATPAVLGMLGTGALSGAETYTQTGNVGAGLVSGAVNALLPGVTGRVEQGILSRLGAREVSGTVGRTWESQVGGQMIPKTVDAVKQFFPTNFGQRAAAFGGGQLAAAGIMGGSELAQQALAGQPISNPFTPEFGLGLGISQIPFSLLHLGGKLVGGAGKSPMERANDLQNLIDLTTRGTNLKAARDTAKEMTPHMKVPEIPEGQRQVATAETLAQTNSILASLGQQRKDIEANPTPENIDKLNEIKLQEDQVGDKQVEQTGGVGVGLAQSTTGTIPIIGESHFYGNKQGKPETGFHIVTVKDNPGEALKYPDGTPVQPGDRIQWPAGRKDPEVNSDSSENFLVPKGRFSKIVDKAMETAKLPERTRDFNEGTSIASPTRKVIEAKVGDIWVDKSIAPIVQALNEQGIETTTSHSGLAKDHPNDKDLGAAYIGVKSAPPQLVQQLEGLGWTYVEGKGFYHLDIIGDKEKAKLALVSNKQDPNIKIKNASADEAFLNRTLQALGKQPDLPDQSGGDLVTHQARLVKAQEDFRVQQEQRKIHLDDLENIRQDLALRGYLGYGEMIDSLQEINRIREQAGYPEIDLATLSKAVGPLYKENRNKGLISVTEETKRFELAQEAAHADALLKAQEGVNTHALVIQRAEGGNQDAKKILDLYEELSASPGNRGLLASSGLFWKEAQELEAKGQLTVGKLAARTQAIVQSPKGPRGMIEKAPEVELPPTIFKALTNEEKTLRQIGAEAILKVTAGDANSDEAKVLRQLVYDGSFGQGLSKEAVVEAFYHARIEDINTDQEAELAAGEWLESPKVQGWMKDLATELQKRSLPDPQFKDIDESPFALRDTSDRKQLPVGGGFVWGLAGYDPATNRLGDKHTLPKSGEVSVAQLKAIGGRGKPLQDVEIEMMKGVDQMVNGGAFDGKGNVNVKKLEKVLKDNPVQFEVKKLGEGTKATEEKRLMHELDTKFPGWSNKSVAELTNASRELGILYTKYKKAYAESYQEAGGAVSHYSWLGSREEKDMPGYVEGLVRIPKEADKGTKQSTRWKELDNLRVKRPLTSEEKAEFQSLGGKEGTEAKAKFTGPHFDKEDKNVISFFRGFEDQSPDGSKVFHVIEVQSDWFKVEGGDKFGTTDGKWFDSRAEANQHNREVHPASDVAYTLALKAIVNHAKEIGVKQFFLPDSETAMMTEGHDKQVSGQLNPTEALNRINNETGLKATKETISGKEHITIDGPNGSASFPVENGLVNVANLEGFLPEAQIRKLFPNTRPSQEKGMALHYDTVLSSAARKLTGDEGRKVEMPGVHKGTGEIPNGGIEHQQDLLREGVITQEQYNNRISVMEPKGSPVFRNPEGSPKSSITGTIYDLSKIQDISEKQGGLTLGDPSRALQEKLPPSYDPSDSKEQVIVDQLSGNGIEQLQSISKDPWATSVAQSWIKQFPNLLKLQQGYVHDGVGTYARGHVEGLGNGIFYDKSNISAKPEARETAVIHEMGHGLTQQLIDELGPDHPLIKELDGIRMRARQVLSPELKAYLDSATKSDWLGRYRRGQAEASELGPDPISRQILYGLLDNKEMTAQLWSSHDFREHFRGIDGRTGVWRKFLEWTKKILGLGNVDNTLLGELLGATGQLMHKGEWLADMEGFGERWFESQGKGGAYGQAQTQRAMGILAEINDGMSPEEMSGSLQMGEGKFNPELVRKKAALEQTFQNLDEETQQLHSVLDEHGQDASVNGVDNMVLDAMSDGKGLEDTLDLLPDSAVKYIFVKLDDHKDVLDVLAAATKEKNNGLINIVNPKLVSYSVRPALKQVERILRNRDRHLDLAQKLVNLQAVEPQGFVNAAASYTLKDTENFIEGEGKGTGGIMSWLSRFLEPMAQKARRLPEMAEGISKGFELGPNARKMFSEAMKVFGMDTSSPNLDVLSHDSVQQSQKVFQTPKELNAVDKWIHQNQEEGKEGVVMLPESHPEVQKILSKLTTEEKERVRDMVAKQGKSTQMLNAEKLEKMKQIAAVSAAGHILKESGLKVKDAIGLADATIKAIVDMNDPVMQLTAQSQLQAIQARLQPEVFLELLKFSQGEATKINDWKSYFDKNPFWATAQRTERYHVKGRNKAGKQIFNQASSLQEAREVAERLGLAKLEITDSWKGREDEPFSFPNMPPEMAQRMGQIEENQIQMLKQSGVIDSPEAEADYRRTSAVTQILREATSNQAIPGVQAPVRRLTQGAEELPWMWNHISNAQRESNYWSRQLLRAQARTYLRDPELATNELLRKDLATHYENLLHPDPEIAQKMTKFASTWFLGFNLASSLINAAQPFATHVGELTAISGKPIDSYKRVLRALSELGGRFVGKKEWASAEHEKFMNEAVKDGEVGVGMFDDEQAAQESIATNYKRAMMKNKSQSIGQRLGTAAGTYSNVSMWVFQHGERLNARSALLASFDLYRDMGVGFEEAKQKAYEFNRSVNYSGGRAQRPVGAFSGRGAFPRTAAMLGTSLQSYVLGTTFQIARYLQKGLFRPTGATPHEVFAARKAAIQMLGTQFAAAGLLGMPFVSGAIGLLDKLFPDLELNKHVRQGVSGFLSSDKDNGNVLTDIAMTGVPSMLGWDLQSRLSMGNSLPGVSEINGFQPENLMGPMGNVVRNFVGGVQGFVKGDPSASTSFLPPAIKKAVQLGTSALTDQVPGRAFLGEIRDYQGRPIAEPTRSEQVGLALGFQPKRLSDQNAAARIATQVDQVVSRHESQDRMEMAQDVLKGNFGTVRNRLLSQARDDKNYNPQDAVKAIARSAEELTFPRDLRREGRAGTGNDRAGLLNSFSNLSGGVSQASEVQRLQYRMGIEQKLGLQPQSFRSDLAMAQMMDQLRQQSPLATRSQLRAIAQQQLRRSAGRQPMLQDIQE